MTEATFTRFETVGELAKALHKTKGPIFADVLAGDYDPITVQIVKADLMWKLDTQLETGSRDVPFYIMARSDGTFLISNN